MSAKVIKILNNSNLTDLEKAILCLGGVCVERWLRMGFEADMSVLNVTNKAVFVETRRKQLDKLSAEMRKTISELTE